MSERKHTFGRFILFNLGRIADIIISLKERKKERDISKYLL